MPRWFGKSKTGPIAVPSEDRLRELIRQVVREVIEEAKGGPERMKAVPDVKIKTKGEPDGV
jgi:hypothetical protein